MRRWAVMLKRALDIAVSLITIMLLSPVITALALLVLCFLGWPVLFHQQRPSLGGRPFMLHKFRTMSDERDDDGQLAPDAQRLGGFGKFLRSTSLDELPELWNVLMGDMSLVGPRPLLMEYLELYDAEQSRRHEVRPGLTGWVQVNGRNSLSWEEKFALDVWYVDNRNLLLDLKIMLLTVLTIARREGISADNHVSAAKFQGNNR